MGFIVYLVKIKKSTGKPKFSPRKSCMAFNSYLTKTHFGLYTGKPGCSFDKTEA